MEVALCGEQVQFSADCSFTGNSAVQPSGGTTAMGGAIYADGVAAIQRTTFSNNFVTAGNGSNGGAFRCGDKCSATLVADTFVNNQAHSLGANPLYGAGGAIQTTGSGFTGASGNIDQDPLFVNTQPATIDLRLSAGSPCIDSGGNADLAADLLDLDGDANKTEAMPFDLAGAARVQNSTLDIGAFEASH